MSVRKILSVVGAGIVLAGVSGQANAVMTLTQAGIDQGLVLSTFASGYANTGGNGVGPISYINVPGGGGSVLTTSYADGKLISFGTNADGQTVSGGGVASTSTYSAPTGLAVLGGNIYMAAQGPGAVYQVDGSGNLVATLATGIQSATGLAASSATGLLYVSSPGGSAIYSVNPGTFAVTTFVAGSYDGLSVTSNGAEIFADNLSTNRIQGFDTTTGNLLFTSDVIAGADGALVANLSGNAVLFVNTNFGEIYEVSLATGAATLIASGGSRGDLASLDTANNTALFSQTDLFVRLALPAGSNFGTDTAVPEPASLALFGVGLLGLARARRRG